MDYLHFAGARCLVRETRGLRVVLLALSHPPLRSRLKEFCIDSSCDILNDKHLSDHFQPGLSSAILGKPDWADELIETLGSCPRLAKLRMSIGSSVTIMDESTAYATARHTGRLMASLLSLEDILLGIRGMPVWLAVPDDTFYPNLRRLTISCAEIWPKKFVALLNAI